LKIYTKTGDDGTTGLFNGSRVPKDSLRVEAYGTVDELNSILGILSCYQLPEKLGPVISEIIRMLFNAGTDLATPAEPKPKFEVNRIGGDNILFLEKNIDLLTSEMPPLRNFILPGGTIPAATAHHARTVCRRAERCMITLSQSEKISDEIIIFFNRLSDFLFTTARYINFKAGLVEEKW
jgi:cob(I)alamin adenosyltransferase